MYPREMTAQEYPEIQTRKSTVGLLTEIQTKQKDQKTRNSLPLSINTQVENGHSHLFEQRNEHSNKKGTAKKTCQYI
jgi:hypothetical protein